LQSNVGGFPGVHLSNLGVGATIGQSTLIEIDRPDQSSFLAPAEAAYGEVVAHTQVQVTTLDEYCRTAGIDYIDILKTDTQGFELEVLRGAAGLIAEQRINLLHMEVIFASIYEDIPPFDAVYRFLLDHGFELVGFYQLEFVNQRAGWCDCLAVNPSFVRCSS
jgi:FkbM family methyltransferase